MEGTLWVPSAAASFGCSARTSCALLPFPAADVRGYLTLVILNLVRMVTGAAPSQLFMVRGSTEVDSRCLGTLVAVFKAVMCLLNLSWT